MAVTVFHVAVTCCDDYLTRRRSQRDAHHAQLDAWRTGGQLVGGGPAPDGRTVDLVWRARADDEVARLMAEDLFVIDGLWISWVLRSFTDFVEPLELPPIDGSRQATLVEGRATDRAKARKALVDMRDAAKVAFGGIFESGDILALALTADAERARRWFAATTLWSPRRLSTRPLYYVL